MTYEYGIAFQADVDSGVQFAHREGMTKAEAAIWLQEWYECCEDSDGPGTSDMFVIVRRPKGAWELVPETTQTS